MASGQTKGPATEGLRERKRRETLQRITAAGMRLFIKQGYDNTTLDEIAAEAGISRRTFFYYFKSKDEILLSMQRLNSGRLTEAVRNAPAGASPLETIRDAVIRVSEEIPAREMIGIHRLMKSSAAVQARKHITYVENENALVEALRVKFPGPKHETALKLAAMMSVGAMRLAVETLDEENGKRPLPDILRDIYATLDKGV
ncbi:MAG TPA: helix-turn-helix domain-containing protein [Hyphomonas sp.]|nr:TetR family transcriptional regulator [Hyphomonas sp.]HRJ01556.1 helix-turn-helix domain-containing protein [Hyphomonas sp.]HRK67491.1 helix-turn-helix domain-containing protein [Hyphomonas sp.]